MVSSPRRRITPWRLTALSGAFALIVIAPLLNYYFQFSFIQGWYQSISIGNLWFVSPLEGMESILTSRLLYVPLLIGMVIPLVLALLLGRVFCSWVCPISFLSELLDRLRRPFSRKRFHEDRLRLPRRTLWFALMAELLVAMILGTPVFVFLSPPGLVGREIMVAVFFHTLVLEGVIVLAVLGLHLLTRRFFCRYLCPLGALLGLIGAKRRLVVQCKPSDCNECGLCQKTCPLALRPFEGEGDSAYCWNCGECVDGCPERALDFHWTSQREGINPAQICNPPLDE